MPVNCRMGILLGAAFLVAIVATGAAADESASVLSDYTVTSWTTNDGLPTGFIRALTQDSAGYLLLGMDTGIVRFDGARFRMLTSLGGANLPRGAVQALHTARDGSVWVGYESGAVARIQGETVSNFTQKDGVGPGSVSALAEDRDGAIWVAGEKGLYRYHVNQWEPFHTRLGLSERPISWAFVDRGGTLWVANVSGIFRFDRERSTFDLVEPPAAGVT